MAAENLTVFGAIDDERHGVTLPRIFTPPLRPLTKETSNGFAVIAFAEIMLHVHLYPWQQWLLVHALELLEDGSYRFRKVIVLVWPVRMARPRLWACWPHGGCSSIPTSIRTGCRR